MSKLRARLLATPAGVACWLAAALAAAAGPTKLESRARPGEVTHVELLLEVGGDLRVSEDGKVRPVPMSVVGKMQYDERIVSRNDSETTSVRSYSTAEAVIKLDKGSLKPVLRADRQVIGVRATDAKATIVSPVGSLTRDELELIDLPANTLIIDRLLPDGPVSVGDQWKHTESLMTALLGIDAVSQTDVTSELKDLDDRAARVEVWGIVQGAVDGISTQIEIKGRYKYDREVGRITWLAFLLEEKRSIGHVAPGADVVARLQMTIVPTRGVTRLSDAAMSGIVLTFDPAQELLEHTTTDGGLRFTYDRRWHVMKETAETVAMRLVDRGDLIAQCNVSKLPTIDPAKRPSMARFQDDIKTSLAKSFGEFIQASEQTTPAGVALYRAVAQGRVSELPIQWNYFHLGDQLGHQAVFAFTLEQDLAERFADADQAIIASVQFLEPTSTASRLPTTR
jgi:hypothetical protein